MHLATGIATFPSRSGSQPRAMTIATLSLELLELSRAALMEESHALSDDFILV